jgi:predicted PurR-regulated permease PerM
MAHTTPPEDHRVFIRRILTVALVLIAIAIVVWLIVALRNVLFMVFVSVFVAVAFEPPVHLLEKRGWRRGAATGVVFMLALILGVGFIGALAPLFVEQVDQLIDAIPGLVEGLGSFLIDTLGFDLSEIDFQDIGQDIVKAIQSVGVTVVGGIIGLTSSIFGFIFFATTVALFSFYMVAELPKLQRTVLSFMPEGQQRRALHIWGVAVEKMGGYIYSRLILAFFSGAVAFVFLQFLEVRFAISLAVWVGVLSQFVPVVGTYLASILPALVALTFNDLATAIWVVVFFVVYQQIENYLISPRITKRTMEIHPAISVAAIIIGGTLMGGIGVILALPMAGIIQAIISESRKSYDVILDADQTLSDG